MMRTLRRMVSWCFLVEAILCLGWAAWSLHSLIFTRDTAGSYAQEFVALSFIGVFAVAAWALRREELARKGWVIAASVLNLLLSLAPPLFYGWLLFEGIRLRPGIFMHAGRPIVMLIVLGVLGLIVLPRERSAAKVAEAAS